MSSLGLRIRVFDNQYITFIANGLLQDTNWLLKDNIDIIYGGGIKYSVNTTLGPLDGTLGFSNAVNKPTLSASFGYWF